MPEVSTCCLAKQNCKELTDSLLTNFIESMDVPKYVFCENIFHLKFEFLKALYAFRLFNERVDQDCVENWFLDEGFVSLNDQGEHCSQNHFWEELA